MELDKKKLLSGVFFPSLFVVILWVIKLMEMTFDINFTSYGLHPRTYSGLTGIIASPLIHINIHHLFSNSIPLLILGSIIFYFYRAIAFQVFFWIYFITGIWVWVAGRDLYHIGASGIIYGFVSFLFFSGLFRKDKRLLALSLLVTFIYGTLVWGIFPFRKGVSWESHLLGSVAGIIIAFFFRKEGPKAKKYEWEEENEEENKKENEFDSSNDQAKRTSIQYIYIPEKDEEINKNSP